VENAYVIAGNLGPHLDTFPPSYLGLPLGAKY